MEWANNNYNNNNNITTTFDTTFDTTFEQYYSSFEASLDDILSPQFEITNNELNANNTNELINANINASDQWTFEENKLFENALAVETNPISAAFFENVALNILPWRSMEDIQGHYQALVSDVQMIELGNIPIPNYDIIDNINGDLEKNKEIMVVENTTSKKSEGASASNDGKMKKSSSQQRRKGVPWTEQEHQLFLMGLNKYGKGDWRSISRYYVITKTPTQVASHAQKYFRRQTSTTPPDRRRPSIHDIQTVNPITFTQRPLGNYNYNNTLSNINVGGVQDQTVIFSSCGAYNVDVGNTSDSVLLSGHNFNGFEGIQPQQTALSSFVPMESNFSQSSTSAAGGYTYSRSYMVPSPHEPTVGFTLTLHEGGCLV